MSGPVYLLLVLLAVSPSVLASECPESDQIQCQTSSRCTRVRYICDGDNDCGDNSDENRELCNAWRNEDCSRNEVKCYRFGASECVTIKRYCELTDPTCEGDLDPRLCQMLSNGKIQELDSIVVVPQAAPTVRRLASALEESERLGDEFKARVEQTLKHEGCPQLFTKIGGACVSVFYPGNVTWGEAREFCRTIGGELLSLSQDYTFYATLVQHLKEQQMTADFWLGGTRLNETADWEWLDETPVDINSPLWSIRHTDTCNSRLVQSAIDANVTRLANQGHCYHFSRAPAEPMDGQCLALTYNTYFQMSDENCNNYKSPLCWIV